MKFSLPRLKAPRISIGRPKFKLPALKLPKLGGREPAAAVAAPKGAPSKLRERAKFWPFGRRRKASAADDSRADQVSGADHLAPSAQESAVAQSEDAQAGDAAPSTETAGIAAPTGDSVAEDSPAASVPDAPEPGAAAPKKRRKTWVLVAAGGALGLIALGAAAWFFVAPWLGLRTAPALEQQADASDAARTNASQTNASKTHDEPKTHDESKTAEGKAGGEGKAGAEHAATTKDSGPPALPSEIEAKVRRLQDVEEKVAAGDVAALAEMPRLIHSLSQELAAAAPQSWTQPRNARALTLFLLSGGESAVGRKVLAVRDPAAAEPALLKGAVAYLEGVDSPERDALLDLEPRQLDPALGAQLAFVQSILLASYDRGRAMARLDLARLLAPGGLVEEAALRREIGLAAEMNEIDKFAALSRQYWMRYRASPYAENFLRQFAAAAARTAQSIDVAQWIQFDEFMEALSPERRKQLFLTMARAAAVAGNSAFADFSARRVLGLAARDSQDAARAQLYGAMANVAGPGSRDAVSGLGAIDRSALPIGDQPLYDAVALVAARLYRPPSQDFSAPPDGVGDLAGGDFGKAESDLAAAAAGLEAAQRSMERKTR